MPNGYKKHAEAAGTKTKRGGNSKVNLWNPNVGYRNKKAVEKAHKKASAAGRKWTKKLMADA